MLRLDVLGSAFAHRRLPAAVLRPPSATSSSTSPTTFGYSEQRTNALATWYWAANAHRPGRRSALLSDRLRVRKPFMVRRARVGLDRGERLASPPAPPIPDTAYSTFAWLFVAHRRLQRRGLRAVDGELHRDRRAAQPGGDRDRSRGVGLDGARSWSRSRRPASPLIVTAATPLVEHGAEVAEAQRKAGPALEVVGRAPSSSSPNWSKLRARTRRHRNSPPAPRGGDLS